MKINSHYVSSSRNNVGFYIRKKVKVSANFVKQNPGTVLISLKNTLGQSVNATYLEEFLGGREKLCNIKQI